MFEKILSPENLVLLCKGAVISLEVAAAGTLIGVTLGTIGALGRISKHRVPYGISTLYVELIRGTPMLLQILFMFLAVPMLILGITGHPYKPNVLVIGILAIGINSGAYTAELIRSAIQAIDKGQMEAARSQGLSYVQAMYHIVLPQAFKQIVPPLVTEFITLIKDSSLLSTIGVIELMTQSKAIGARYYNYILPLLAASVIYLVMTLSVSRVSKYLEKRLAESD
jgi:polar amino acid transport system permease protein